MNDVIKTTKPRTKPANQPFLTREEYIASVGKQLSVLNKHKETLTNALANLVSAQRADVAWTTIEQINQLLEEMGDAKVAATEIARCLKLRTRSKMREVKF